MKKREPLEDLGVDGRILTNVIYIYMTLVA